MPDKINLRKLERTRSISDDSYAYGAPFVRCDPDTVRKLVAAVRAGTRYKAAGALQHSYDCEVLTGKCDCGCDEMWAALAPFTDEEPGNG